MKDTPESPALQFLTRCWEGIPRRSWRNRNGAMHSALTIAIESGMHFEPGDMVEISKRFNAGYWTSDGEGIYSLACSARSGDNLPAAMAIEKWMGRPPFLWAERTRVAERLYVGARFTWQGHYVTVTSLDAARLVACTYKDNPDRRRDADYVVGETVHVFNEYRRLEALHKTKDGTIMARVSAKVPYERSTIARRFTVTIEELNTARKAYDHRRKAYERDLAAAETLADLEPIRERFAADGPSLFRHFDIEIIRAAFTGADSRIREALSAAEREAEEKKARAIRERRQAADLKRWMEGEDVRGYFTEVRLRVKGEWVETSTQQKASVAGVRQALAFIKKHRRKGWQANGTTFDLDQYPIQSIQKDGVQVGCTLVPWSEVARIAALLP